MSIQTLLKRCRELGATFTPGVGGKLKVEAPAPLPAEIRAELKARKAEVVSLLTRPHINDLGELIVPFECDPKYHYWKPGGQSLALTLQELNAPPDVWRRYVGSYTETKQ